MSTTSRPIPVPPILRDYRDEAARAAGWDAGNRSARAAGRDRWDGEDYDAAAAEYWRIMGGEDAAEAGEVAG